MNGNTPMSVTTSSRSSASERSSSGSAEESCTVKPCSCGQRSKMCSSRAARSSSIAGRSALRVPSWAGFMPPAPQGSGPPKPSRVSDFPCHYTSRMEHGSAFLLQASVYFAAAVLAVMVAHRLGLGSVAGYLLAGIAIGPWGFRLVEEPEAVHAFAELGVVFLLFVIGLELEPHRLWSMRKRLAGLGVAQVLGSTALIAVAALAVGIDARTALVAGMALSLSSTALALAPLTDRGALGSHGGQSTFAVLLFQDLAVIPMLALLPLLGSAGGGAGFSWLGVLFALGAIAGTLVLGHFIARPVFRHIARTRLREIFTAFALLLVLGISLLFERVGLSMALGAFLAGVLLAESEYRHEIEAAIDPFKGLLLGLFFISVGMGVDFS